MTDDVLASVLVSPDGTWGNVLTLIGRRYDMAAAIEKVLPCRRCGADARARCRTLTTGRTTWTHGVRWQNAQLVVRALWPDADTDTRVAAV